MSTFRPRRSIQFLPALLCYLVLGSVIWPGAETGRAELSVSASPTNLPLVSIRQFLDSARQWGETNIFRLQGVVTASLSDKTYFLQDGDAGVYVFHRPTQALRVGEWVEVTGHPSLGNLKPLLDGTAVRSLGTRESPAPVTVTFAEAMSGQHHMRLIRIKGRLAEERLRGGRNLVLNAGGPTNSFVADIEALSDYEAVSWIQPGSLIELTGVCTVRANAARTPESFRVFVRSSTDVAVVSGPPWWTRERVLAGLGIALGALALALLSVWTLRRQVGRQTADLRARLEKERALEQRYRQLFEANPHPMWVYDLETLRFLAVNEMALRHYGYSRAEFLGMTLRDIQPPADRPVTVVVPGVDRAHVYRHRKKDGQVLEVEVTSHKIEFDGCQAEVVLALDVTERRHAQDELQRSKERFATIFRATPDAILIGRVADGRIVEVNPAFERLLGFMATEAVGQTTGDLGVWVDPAERASLIARLQAEGSVVNCEARIRTKSGRVFHALSSAEIIDYDGQPCMLSLTRDITERKEAEQLLRRSEASLAAAQHVAGLGSWELELSSLKQAGYSPLTWSDEVFRIFGYEPGGLEVTRENFFRAVHPEDHESVRLAVAEAIERRRPYRIEHRIVRPDGSERIVQEYSEITFDPATGRPLRMLGVVQDITERKASEAERLRAFETLQLFIDSVPGYVSFVDAGQRYQLVNPSYEQWFGRTRSEIIGRRLDELHSTAAYLEIKPLVERALKGEQVRYQCCLDDTAGQPHWFDVRYIPRKASDGTVTGFFALVLDVTAQKQAEMDLRESRERLDSILSSLDDVVWSSSTDGSKILFLNRAVEAVSGRPRESFYADPKLWLKIIHPEDQPAISAGFERLIGGQALFDFEHRIVRPDGSARWVRKRARIVRDSFGNPLRIDGIASDITARKQAEEDRANFDRQIQQTQKLESLGVLAGGIAHDFNNLLTAVMGNIALAMHDLVKDNPVRDPLLEAEKATQRAADLARQMLAYSGKGRFVIQQIRLSSVIEEMASMLQVSMSKRATLRVILPEHESLIEADATQLRQIILNLVINASEAIGERSGIVAVSTGTMECDQAFLKTTWLKDPLPEGRYAYLEVSDTGCGIHAGQLSKIFDPFFTTKFTGRGLGLAAVLGIVRSHKSAIKVHSEVGQGTSFTVLFPAVGEAPNLPAKDNGRDTEWRGHGLVLLVDDEESIRLIGTRMLQRLGFEVFVASDGCEALARIREQGDRIRAILLDLTMPRMDGEETFRELQRIRTDIPVVLSSGYTEEDVVQRFAGKAIAGFVHKPYNIENLRTAFKPLVDKRPPEKTSD